MRIFVTGGTGFVGTVLVRQLKRKGYQVRCLARPDSDTRAARAAGAELVQGDVTDADSLVSALDGVAAAVHLAAATGGQADDADRLAVNVRGTENLVSACRARNVRRLLEASTTAVTAQKKSNYASTKLQAEQVIQDSDLDHTILRLNLVYGPGTRGLFQRMARQIQRLPVVPVVGPGTYHLQPVHVNDVADAVMRCLERDATIGRRYDIVGPDRVTFDELLLLMQEVMGVEKRLVHIPLPLALWGARLMGRLLKNPPFREGSVLGLNQEKTYDPAPAAQDLAFSPISLADGLRDTFGIHRVEIGSSPPAGGEQKRVAVVGLGKMGVAHATVLNTMANAKLVGLMDLSERQRTYVSSLGLTAPFYNELSVLLAETRPEAVWICTPPSSHLPIVEACVNAGTNVFVEKPLAESLESARRIYELVVGRQITHACGYSPAYRPVFWKARSLLRAGALGDLYRFRASMYMSKVLSPADADRGWQSDPSVSGGGVVANVSSHLLFLLHWYFGRARRLQAWFQQPYSQKVEDAATAIIEFESGLVGQVDSSWSLPGYQTSRIELVVEGLSGTLWLDAGSIQLHLSRPQPGYEAGWHTIHVSDIESPPGFDLGGDGLFAEDADFLDRIGTERLTRSTCYDGFRVQELIAAIYDSASHNLPVLIDGEPSPTQVQLQPQPGTRT